MSEITPNPGSTPPASAGAGEGAKATESAQPTGSLGAHAFTQASSEQFKLPAALMSMLGAATPSQEEKLDDLHARDLTNAARQYGEGQDLNEEGQRKAGGPEDIIPIIIRIEKATDSLDVLPKLLEEQELELDKTEETEELDDKLEEDQEKEKGKKKNGEGDGEEEVQAPKKKRKRAARKKGPSSNSR